MAGLDTGLNPKVLCAFAHMYVLGDLIDILPLIREARTCEPIGRKCIALGYCDMYLVLVRENKINSIFNAEMYITETRNWLEKAVIGLNLCPFAKAVHVRQQIRYVVSNALDIEALLLDLGQELILLANSNPESIDTILLIHPHILVDFLDYNDFLELADQFLEQQDYSGEFQIASFHPEYQFAGTARDAIENYTNRSPYPMLHVLRESSIERAVNAFPDAAGIFEKNIATMKRLGNSGWAALFGGGKHS